MDMLPIGTIIVLKTGTKSLMIVGYLAKDVNNNDKDYMGVPYPEGITSLNSVVTFNKEDIKEIKSKGYENIFYDKFKEKLNENGVNI